MFIKTHKLILGPIVFVLGVLNASLGFRLAMNYILNWVYLGCVVFMIIVVFLISWKRAWFQRRWGPKQPAAGLYGAAGAPNTYGGGAAVGAGIGAAGAAGAAGYTAAAPSGPYGRHYDTSPFGTRSDIALSNMGDPPAYSAPPTRPREFA
jgi:hypothetical protein